MIIAVEGLPGTGKTYCLKKLASENIPNVLCLNPFSGKPSLYDQYRKCAERNHRYILAAKATTKTIQHMIMRNRDKIIYVENYLGLPMREKPTDRDTPQSQSLNNAMCFAQPDAMIYIESPPEVAYMRNAWIGLKPWYSLDQHKAMAKHYNAKLMQWADGRNVTTIINQLSTSLDELYAMFLAAACDLLADKPEDMHNTYQYATAMP